MFVLFKWRVCALLFGVHLGIVGEQLREHCHTSALHTTQVPQFAQQHVQVLFQRLWELMMVIPDTVAHNATQGNAPSQEDILQVRV